MHIASKHHVHQPAGLRAIQRLLMAVFAAGLLAAAADSSPAQEVPSIVGQWKIDVDLNRKVIITQKGTEISGRAVRKDGSLVFQFSGTIDAEGKVTLKVFFDRSDASRAPPQAFAEAVNLTGDKDHPGLLPAKSAMDFKYDRDKDQLIGHILKLNITINHNPKDGENHDNDTLKQEKEIPVEATLTRTYASLCAATMGEIPAFTCTSGAPLPITASTAPQSRPVAQCDKPIQLPLKVDEGQPSQCVPGSTLVKIDNVGHPDVETLAICRKYNKSFSNKASVFNDIAMVSYDTKTGQTCFFQSKTGAPFDTASLDSSGKIPSPTADNAGVIWQEKSADTTTRSGTGPDGVRCNACHSAGPFIWTPYVGQATNIDIGRWGQAKASDPYDSNFANMFGRVASTFRFKDNACVECHRVGDGTDCNSFVPSFTTSPDTRYRLNATNLWMPPSDEYYSGTLKENDALITALAKRYKDAIAQIADCCTNPGKADCKKTNQGFPPPP